MQCNAIDFIRKLLKAKKKKNHFWNGIPIVPLLKWGTGESSSYITAKTVKNQPRFHYNIFWRHVKS